MKNKMFKKIASVAAISTMLLVAGCNSKDQDLKVAKAKSEERPIVIQGPMPIEAEFLQIN